MNRYAASTHTAQMIDAGATLGAELVKHRQSLAIEAGKFTDEGKHDTEQSTDHRLCT